jgi:demethylmenaquinone methyltransferase/2-methoxy-6-polyprenyl-1,4-benzoquinol methylase
MNLASLGKYRGFIEQAVSQMEIQPADQILDMGCGTGRNAAMMSAYLNGTGSVTGLDISIDMEVQFRRKFKLDKRMHFINQRIDIPFNLNQVYDKIFMSFVIHGFPHAVRSMILNNAFNHLKPGGVLFILDFAEFDMQKMPWFHKFVFEKVECIYAFDFIKHDWKAILAEHGFMNFKEMYHIRDYVRLLKAEK